MRDDYDDALKKKIKFKKMNHEFTVNSSWSWIFQRTEEHMALDLQLTARGDSEPQRTSK